MDGLTTPEAQAHMLKILCSTIARPESFVFREPVDWKALELHDYTDIVKEPRDLGTIKKKLESGGYDNVDEVAKDVRLVWSNCMLYNRDGSEYYHLADAFAKAFEEAYAALRKLVGAGDFKDDNRVPSVEDKTALSYDIFKIDNADMARVLTMIEEDSPAALARKSAADEVLINIDALSPACFSKVNAFVLSSLINGGGPLKKKSKV